MGDFDAVIADFEYPGELDFEQIAAWANELDMTHVLITRDLPWAKWQDDYPTEPPGAPARDDDTSETATQASDREEEKVPSRQGDASSESVTPERAETGPKYEDVPERFRYDPYPSWYVHHPGLLKVAPPEPIQPHVSLEWAEEVADIFERRCEILREHGLKAAYASNEPQVLPESVFVEHPRWRGARVDQPNRAREPHFAPCVTRPKVRELYREAVADLLDRCPEIELFHFKTTDAGSGFCWAESLYPGRNGNTDCRSLTMSERVGGLFEALDAGADDAGVEIEYNLVEIPPQDWMIPTFDDPEGMARELNAGRAINNLEGPDATTFKTNAGTSDWAGTMLYPVTGIPQPVACVKSLQTALRSSSLGTSEPSTGADDERSAREGVPRLEFNVPPGSEELYLDVYESVAAERPGDRVESMEILKSLAADRVGDEHADTLLSLWFAIDDAVTAGETIPSHPPQRIGSVHQRWITRPFVPFPEELDPDEKRYYRTYLFQARSERHAENLVDCQAMRPYVGWAARTLMTFVFDRVEPKLETAVQLAGQLSTGLNGDLADEYDDLRLRLEAARYLIRNGRNAINYQAIRDHVRDRGVGPEDNPVLGTQSSWDRDFMLDTARSEIDNTLALIDLLETADEPLLLCADSEQETDIRRLEPEPALIEHLERKVEIMNEHWTDYRRLFTQPNP